MKRQDVKAAMWNGTEINELRLPETLIPSRCRYYIVKRNEPLDLIAYKFFRDESRWYEIADINMIEDPLTPLESGRRIAIPR